MSEDKNINVSVVPKFAETALENALDKPSKSIGETLDDIWYLVLGGALGQMAEKRKMKYAADLEKFKKKTEEEIEKIPYKKRCEPDLQAIGVILEKSKYCADKELMRDIFAKMIAASMNIDKKDKVSPYLVDIVGNMSESEIRCFLYVANQEKKKLNKIECDIENQRLSAVILEHLGIITVSGASWDEKKGFIILGDNGLVYSRLTQLGEMLYNICVED